METGAKDFDKHGGGHRRAENRVSMNMSQVKMTICACQLCRTMMIFRSFQSNSPWKTVPKGVIRRMPKNDG